MGLLFRVRLEVYYFLFIFIGVDLFGLLMVKWGCGIVKRWGCLFICFIICVVYFEVILLFEMDDFIMVFC